MADAPHARLAALADELERTMRAVGAWREPAPPLRAFSAPFGRDAMPFEHWLQLVLVPRLRALAAAGAPPPPRSELAAHAVREFDGRDEMAPLVDVLRAIDDAGPAPHAAGAPEPRRSAATAALILFCVGWLLTAPRIGRFGAAVATNVFPARVIQTWTGTRAPSGDVQPLRITVSAEVGRAGTLDLRDGELVLLRSTATMRSAPTAPLRFRATKPPAPSDVTAWLATHGVPLGPAADDAVAEALALLQAAASAPTRDALHQLTLDRPVQPKPDAMVELAPRAPAWVETAVTLLALIAGFVPIALGVMRYARAGVR